MAGPPSGARGGEFASQIPFEFRSQWKEQRVGSSFYQGKPAVGGLGFEVTLGGWPRLLQRCFLDCEPHMNNSIYAWERAGAMDIGEVRTSGEAVKATLAERQYPSDDELQAAISEATAEVKRLTGSGQVTELGVTQTTEPELSFEEREDQRKKKFNDIMAEVGLRPV